jgi:hypothetical protein
MTDSTSDPLSPPVHPRRKLAQATAIAALVALIILVVAVLPAEYGIDPTGIGRAMGFSKISEDAPVIVDTTGQGAETVYAFDLAWQVREETLLVRDGELAASAVQERIEVPFADTNLTHMTAILTWQDDDRVGGERTDPDRFEVSLKAPDGRQSQYVSGENDATGAGRIEASLQWRSTPTPALNESGAYTIDAREDVSAQGTWDVLVRLYAAGGNDAGPDPGNSWRLVVKARSYEITNLGTFGSDEPGDRVTLTIQAGGAVEYKFRMEAGANLTYRWSSTAPLTFDFHGDQPGQEDDPTSHKHGVADHDQGNFTAPFSGRHGWWWYNSGQEPITVTLTTQGEYTILGVV